MYISRSLKQSNIAEYLLYMWQVEDLLRANDLDLEKVKESVVAKYELGEEQRAELLQWYSDLIEMMRREGVVKEGHLQINKNVIIDLNDLHLRLMHSPKYPYYQAAYYKVLPFIVELRSKSNTHSKPELENCFDALYGLWMLKLQHREPSSETQAAFSDISAFIGMLSDYYQKDKRGELFQEDEVPI
ncbi:MAG: DUF4924 family protein [Bacteroidaceae bacterium]|nr:DUF4924 family protein [Bacteroidaceae bacterium]